MLLIKSYFTFCTIVFFSGQQFAQQMQSQNPDLVNQLRDQATRSNEPKEGSDPGKLTNENIC